MYAGGISYFSSCSFGFIGCVSPEPVAIAVRETSKIEKMLDVVENFIRCEVVGALQWFKAHASPDVRFINPESLRWRASLPQKSTRVENYPRLINGRTITRKFAGR